MAERNLPDQLDEWIDRMLAQAPAPDAQQEPLAQIAAELLDLPSPSFKARLRTELERSVSMSTQVSATAVSPIPKGFRTVTPYLIAQRCADMIDFVKQAFGAEELFRSVGTAGGIHAEVKLGDCKLMMGGDLAYQGPGAPAALHYYVENVDEAYHRALSLGATSLQEPIDHDYGERGASVKDPFGNFWYLARSFGPRYVPEGLDDITISFHPAGTPKFIEFLQQAFAGDVVSRHESANGTVVHATVRIGNSIVEMGEAHGPYQTMPTTTYLYVPNVDEVYRAALAAGATSLTEPADQPYGDRNAGVKDPWGQTWYLATHIKDVGV